VIPWIDDRRVAVARDAARYAPDAPFHASEAFPEWAGQPIGAVDNPAYRAVRESLIQLGLDRENAGTAAWNPLGDLIRPGDAVVIKPNLVSHRNTGERDYGLTDTDSLVTHGSVIRVTLDYAARALRGSGTIVIGDCPIQGTRWDHVVGLTGLDAIVAHASRVFPGVTVRVEDFRLATASVENGFVVSRTTDDSRRSEYAEIDLGSDSLLCPLMQDGCAFGVAQYPRHRMRRAHTPDRNLYLFPKSFLSADVFINLPKLKTHMKAGVTCALKNLVGINGHKDYLPHFRFGSPKNGGDEYPDGNWLWDVMWFLLHADWELEHGLSKRVLQYAAMVCYRLLRFTSGYPRGYLSVGGGGWHGNDTLWRTILDINRAFFHCDGAAHWPSRNASRRHLAILDGIVSGHRESPLSPTPIATGVVLAAANPVAIDTVATALMGLDWKKIPQVKQAYEVASHRLTNFAASDIEIAGLPAIASVNDIYRTGSHWRFEPSVGFRGAIEYGGEERGTTHPPERWARSFAGNEEVGAGA
jgi:uncharacterized protein (DUF362 family)